MVANVDSTDCRCRCIGMIIGRDLRLVASRLYKMKLPGPGHVMCSLAVTEFQMMTVPRA